MERLGSVYCLPWHIPNSVCFLFDAGLSTVRTAMPIGEEVKVVIWMDFACWWMSIDGVVVVSVNPSSSSVSRTALCTGSAPPHDGMRNDIHGFCV